MTGHENTAAASSRRGEFALLGVLAALWGSSYLMVKIALATIPPVTLIALRVSIAMVFLLAVLHFRRLRLPRDARTWRVLLVQALFNSIASWTLLAWGQQYVDSGLAGVLNSTSPLFVYLITLFFTRHEAISSWKLTGTVLGITGVTLILGLETLTGLGRNVAGEVAVLVAAVLYSGAAIYGKRLASIPPTVSAAGTMVWASAFLVPFSLLVDRPWTLRPSALSMLAVVFLSVACTGAALLLYFRLLRTIGSLGVASQSYLRAGVSVILGVWILNEELQPTAWVGLALIILGVVAINAPSTFARKNSEKNVTRGRK